METEAEKLINDLLVAHADSILHTNKCKIYNWPSLAQAKINLLNALNKTIAGDRMTIEELKRLVALHGPENVLIMIDMLPLRKMLFLHYTSSSDTHYHVPCCIDESHYKVKRGYKVTLRSILPGFGHHHFYISDLLSIINNGHAEVYLRQI